MLFPVIHVDFCDTSNQELQFSLIKYIDEVLGYKLIESFFEGLELLLHALVDAPFCNKAFGTSLVWISQPIVDICYILYVFFLVFFCHFNVATSRLEIDSDDLTESIIVSRERKFKDICYIVVSATLYE